MAYASARMAFFDLMLSLGVGKDDEVILPGATCSVMVNAVLRVGATPIFADIDPDTFGSSHVEIEKKDNAQDTNDRSATFIRHTMFD